MIPSTTPRPPELLSRETLFTLAIHALAALAAVTLASCSPAKWHETATSHTGDPIAEKQTTPIQPQDLHPGYHGFVNPNRLRGLADPDQADTEAPVVLDQNDPIVVDDPTPQGKQHLVKVHIEHDSGVAAPEGPLYIPPQYITPKRVSPPQGLAAANRYFVVENIASQKLRVYERCNETASCANRLLLEADMVVGEETPDHSRRSIVGSFQIESWTKFYEDNAGEYPSWIRGGPLPKSGAPLEEWTRTGLRGAFGWFTAKLGPDAHEQWTHGTWGNGADGDRFIRELITGPRSLDLHLASHGCTRIENQAIAWMHERLPPGTKVIKVYAREVESTAKASATPTAWSWVLTKTGAGRSGPAMSAKPMARAEILDQGVYTPRQVATAVPNANIYRLPESDLRGAFIVDQGRLVAYEHPRGIVRGGYPEKGAIPRFMIARSLRDK